MSKNKEVHDNNIKSFAVNADIPIEILSSPALLFLYYRIEQIMGIKVGSDALIKLNEHLEENCGASFIDNPAAYEYQLTSREQVYNISKYITVNETYFFRESAHFDLLEKALPELVKLGRPIQICSAASSIGCEAYSIAMLFDYHKKNGLDIDFTIDAFDISTQAIETAKNARYTANTIRTDGASWKHILNCYLIQDNNEYIVTEDIRKKVRFFPHNIMRGVDRQYDIIFFRNSLIYFSLKNRLLIMNHLAEALFKNGLLFLGISETASVKHPFLASRFASDIFYFQKTGMFAEPDRFFYISADTENVTHKRQPPKIIKDPVSIKKHIPRAKTENVPVDYGKITDILKTEDGKPNAQKVIEALENNKTDSITGSQLAACALYFLHTENPIKAEKAVSFLEKINTGACTNFLRAEYYFLNNNPQEAENFYNEAAAKDKYFWPAFYRIAALAADGNRTRYKYKIKKTIDSIASLREASAGMKGKDSSREHNYECFIGGFSTNYFLRILEKKLTEQED